jgi:hypothetical protein
LLDEQPERRRLTVAFVYDPLREFFGTTAYSLGVAVALPMLKGMSIIGVKDAFFFVGWQDHKLLTFPIRNFSEYTCGLADGTP